MDVAVDLCLAVPLLFTVLDLILTSIFVRLRGAEGKRPWEPAAAKASQESGPGTKQQRGERPEAGKEAAAEQREEAVEEPSPAAKPIPAAAESNPRQPPGQPLQHEPQEDAESKTPLLGASAGSSLGHPGQVEDAGDHAAFLSKAEEEDLDSEKEKLVVGEPGPGYTWWVMREDGEVRCIPEGDLILGEKSQ
ncbi:matrix-remodeling-associated protein 7-like [Lathamus discolor]|uniref:matrix-remodeling-associated protein 7-like n=1 Tax=Lathamus discolor TaxID=678569 RepID=UPI0032B808AC